jgi:hypothetical protein
MSASEGLELRIDFGHRSSLICLHSSVKSPIDHAFNQSHVLRFTPPLLLNLGRASTKGIPKVTCSTNSIHLSVEWHVLMADGWSYCNPGWGHASKPIGRDAYGG